LNYSDITGQEKATGLIKRIISEDRMPQALILSGIEGIGKRLAAFCAAAHLCCENPGHDGACGNCASCRLLISANHPSISFVASQRLEKEVDIEFGPYGKFVLPNILIADKKEEKKTDITIAQIREMIRLSQLKSGQLGKKIFIIDDISASKQDTAANALLKVLEEAPSNTYMILLAAHEDKLLPTIRSRAQIIRFSPLSPSGLRSVAESRGISSDTISDMQISASAGSVSRLFSILEKEASLPEPIAPEEFFGFVKNWYSDPKAIPIRNPASIMDKL
jgi:DNA polymerase-3 subunit delta'